MSDQSACLPLPVPVGRPRALQVEITSHCNLKCTMCPLTVGATLSSISPANMKEAVWDEVVAAAVEVGRVIMTGFGENATNPRFPEHLEQLDALGVKTSFTTNGIGMRPGLVERLAALEHLEHVNVSIDSPDPALYRKVRGGKLERAWRGLEALSRGLPARVSLTVSSVAMDSTVESLVAMPDLLASLRVEAYLIQGLHDRTTALADDDVRRNPNAARALREVADRCREQGLRFELANGNLLDADEVPAVEDADGARFDAGMTKQCLAPWETPFVDRDGRVFPCCHGDGTAVMGNLTEASLAEVWKSERFEAFRDDLLGGHSMPSICRKCKVAKIGRHPGRYSGEILAERSSLTGQTGLRLVARNTGLAPWTSENPLAIGAHGDKASTLRVEGWASPNRIARMAESVVMPGETASFEFEVGGTIGGPQETFQLVVEDVRWLPGTEFNMPLPLPAPMIRVDPPRPPNYLERRCDGISRRLGSVRNAIFHP